MKKSIFLLLIILGLSTGLVLAAELVAKDAEVLQNVGIQIYPGAEFVNGSLGGEIGIRFASSEKVARVQDFYRETHPTWALNNEYGTWILYDGKSGGGPAAYVDKKQIMVSDNKNLPTWFGLEKGMTTEIVIMVPK